MKLLRALYSLLFLAMLSPAFALSNSSPPPTFPLPWAASASGSYVRNIPVPSQVGIQNGAASLTTGFPPLTFLPISAGGVPPYGQDMNGILKQITQWNQWQNAGGTVSYNGTFSSAAGGYPLNAILAAANSGNFWLNTTDANTSNPDASGAGWSGFSPVYPYVVDGGTANAATATLPVTISSLGTITGRPVSVKKISSANTGSFSLTLNGYAAFVHHIDGTSLNSGDLPGGGIFTVIFDGTYFELQSPIVSQTLGTAASRNATDPSQTYVSSVVGSITNTHVPIFADGTGSIKDSGFTLGSAASKTTSNNSLSIVSAVSGATTSGNVAQFVDSSGSISDSGVSVSSINAALYLSIKGYILFTTSGGTITSISASSTALASNFVRVSTGTYELLASAMPATTIGWFTVQSETNGSGAANSDCVGVPSATTYFDGNTVWGFAFSSLAHTARDPAKAMILVY
jgi:hypothetical protein